MAIPQIVKPSGPAFSRLLNAYAARRDVALPPITFSARCIQEG